MWEEAIRAVDRPAPEIVSSENCDALPYVPAPILELAPDLGADDAVLDVGCLGGYGLFDFAMRRKREEKPIPMLHGVDISEASIELARKLAPFWGHAVFEKASVEQLPYVNATFRLIVARLVLPYVRMAAAAREMARVCADGGLVFVQYHGFPYYWRNALRQTQARSFAYYAKAILSGIWYAMTGLQFDGKWLSETALSPRSARRLMEGHGLEVVWEGGFATKPMLAARKGREGNTGIPACVPKTNETTYL